MTIRNEKTRLLLARFLREGIKSSAGDGDCLALMLYGAYKDKEAEYFLGVFGAEEERVQGIAGLLERAIAAEWTAWDWLSFGPLELLEKPLAAFVGKTPWQALRLLGETRWGATRFVSVVRWRRARSRSGRAIRLGRVLRRIAT